MLWPVSVVINGCDAAPAMSATSGEALELFLDYGARIILGLWRSDCSLVYGVFSPPSLLHIDHAAGLNFDGCACRRMQHLHVQNIPTSHAEDPRILYIRCHVS